MRAFRGEECTFHVSELHIFTSAFHQTNQQQDEAIEGHLSLTSGMSVLYTHVLSQEDLRFSWPLLKILTRRVCNPVKHKRAESTNHLHVNVSSILSLTWVTEIF